MECFVPDCPNDSSQGVGYFIMLIGSSEQMDEIKTIEMAGQPEFICGPCKATLVGHGDKHSQLYRNTISIGENDDSG